mgnify:FL=1
MKAKLLFGILFFILGNVIVFAQKSTDGTTFKSIENNVTVDKAFNLTIDYLRENGYFLTTLDKQSGFIQAKIYSSNKRLMSGKMGEKRILNFLIRPIHENLAQITLDIYIEEFVFHGTHNAYYYEDKGISNDSSVYIMILDELQKKLTLAIDDANQINETNNLLSGLNFKKELLIIDGVEHTSINLDMLDTKYIDSISFIDSHEAINLYGKKGENGVIKVILKKGFDYSALNNSKPAIDSKLIIIDGQKASEADFKNLNPSKILSLEILPTNEDGKDGIIVVKTND